MKKIGLILSVLLLFVIGGVLLLPVWLPVDAIAEKARDHVKMATGRDLVFSNMEVTFWPNPGLKLTDISLSNPSWARHKNMLELGEMNVVLAIKPLLNKQIEVKRFQLISPVIYLETDVAGKQSWVFSQVNKEVKSTSENKGVFSSSVTENLDFKFGDFEVTKGEIVFLDHKKKTPISMEGIDVSIFFPSLQSALQVEGALTYKKKRVGLQLAIERPLSLIQGETSPGQMRLKTKDVSLKASGSLAFKGEMLKGHVEADIPSLSTLLAWASDTKKKTLPFEKVSFKSMARLSKTDMVLSNAALDLDDVRAKGDLNISFSGKPDIFARLSLNALDLDRFGVGKKKSSSSVATKKSVESWDTTSMNFEPLNLVNADMVLKTKGFSFRGIELGSSTLTATLLDGHLGFSSSKAKLFGGEIKSELDLDVSQKIPTLSFELDVKGAEAKSILKEFISFDKMSGKIKAKISGQTKGKTQKDFISNLKGKGLVDVRNGTLKGIDFEHIATVLVKSRNSDVQVGKGQTNFSKMRGSFIIKKGIVHNDDLQIKSAVLKTTGKGIIDLPKKYIRYRVTPVLSRTAANNQTTTAQQQTAGLSVPLNIKGPFARIRIKPDFKSVIRDIIKDPKAVLNSMKAEQNIFQKDMKTLREGSVKALKNLFTGFKNLGKPSNVDSAVEPQK